MWDVKVSIIGRCRDCGDDLATDINVRATYGWVDQYHGDDRMRRSINHAVVRLVVARHKRHCLGRPAQRLALAAVNA